MLILPLLFLNDFGFFPEDSPFVKTLNLRRNWEVFANPIMTYCLSSREFDLLPCKSIIQLVCSCLKINVESSVHPASDSSFVMLGRRGPGNEVTVHFPDSSMILNSFLL